MSTNFTKRALFIPQFDILTLGAQVFGLLFTLTFFYYLSISVAIPNFIEVKKFRNKKLIKNATFISTMNLEVVNSEKLTINAYKCFIK